MPVSMTPPSIDKDEHTNYKKKDPYQGLKLGEKYSEKDLLRESWQKLKNRRNNRKKRSV